MSGATGHMEEVGPFYWQSERAPYSVYNLNLILLIALKWQVTGSLISTLFPKLLIKIQETITFHRVEKCRADNVFFPVGFCHT